MFIDRSPLRFYQRCDFRAYFSNIATPPRAGEPDGILATEYQSHGAVARGQLRLTIGRRRRHRRQMESEQSGKKQHQYECRTGPAACPMCRGYWGASGRFRHPEELLHGTLMERKNIMAEFFTTDPKYNGLHVCPRCGDGSNWRAVDMDRRLIRVECSGKCRTYEEVYPQLQDLPFYRD